MKKLLHFFLYSLLALASMETLARNENILACMRLPFPDAQVKELDCYTDFDIKTRDGYQCFIKFAPSENIKRELLNDQQEEWTDLELGKTALATYENKKRQPQILVFKNAGTGAGKIDVRILADEKRSHSSGEIAKAIGAQPVYFENNLESFNNLKKALGRTPAQDCPSPYSVMIE